MTAAREDKLVFDLYQPPVQELETVRELVETLLSITFSRRESGWHVPTFTYRGDEGEEVHIQENADPGEGDYVEPQFNTIPVLVYVDGFTDDAALKIRAKLEACRFTLLRHEMV